MKRIHIIIGLFMAIGINMACTSAQKEEQKISAISKSDNVEVYYFHYSRRCATCNAVEQVSKEAVADYYGSKVAFMEYNLDEEAGAKKGEELGISGQTLLIVSGDTKINITNEGFLNARSNPDKLKTVIREKIDSLL